MQDDKPVSLIQVNAWGQLNILTNNSGNSIIKVTSGTVANIYGDDFGYIQTTYEYDKVISAMISKAKTKYGIIYSHTKDVDGKEVSITQPEYLGLMQKYGSVGYLDTAGDLKNNEIVIDSWKLLMAYK